MQLACHLAKIQQVGCLKTKTALSFTLCCISLMTCMPPPIPYYLYTFAVIHDVLIVGCTLQAHNLTAARVGPADVLVTMDLYTSPKFPDPSCSLSTTRSGDISHSSIGSWSPTSRSIGSWKGGTSVLTLTPWESKRQ